MSIVDLVAEVGMTRSKGEARRLLQNGGIYLNNVQIGDVERTVSLNDAIEGQFAVLRAGKKRYHLVRLV